MFCNHCGFELEPNTKFCPRCGALQAQSQAVPEKAPASPPPVPRTASPTPPSGETQPPYPAPPVQENPAQKKKGKSTVLFAVLSVILAVILVLQNLGIVGLLAGKGTSRLEGKGYASAEDAVTAYIDALRCGDVPAMVSTFAVESYVDHFDTEAQLNRLGLFHFYMNQVYELTGSDYEKQLRYGTRQSQITESLRNQLIFYTAYLETESNLFENRIVPFYDKDDPEEALEEFLDIFRTDSFHKALSEIALEEFIDPEDLEEHYGSEDNQNNMERIRKVYGCDDYKSVAALVTLDGEKWLLTMDCGSYDGRWYNISPNSNISMMLGFDSSVYGLAPYSEIR
ncbi:MAG: zinc-ribbon domain-containing protein [Lachnospiraceae bacterium]|nr:zinc-ribbon domain-containing protein [Lachnospiraceae bacterium]